MSKDPAEELTSDMETRPSLTGLKGTTMLGSCHNRRKYVSEE